MTVSRTDVLHVAGLARLTLTEEEIQAYTEQLNAILNYAKVLERLDTDKVIPTAHAVPLQNVMREDQVMPSLEQEKVLANAPEEGEGFFVVPKIV